MGLQDTFEGIGARFLMPLNHMEERLKGIRGFIFDWDGVFNDGTKAGSEGSPFSEPDSMGLNMLRFSYWLVHGEIPFTAIITGANNKTAIRFAEREHLHAVILNAKDKGRVLEAVAKKQGLHPSQFAFSFDDILDLSAAEIAGLRLFVQRAGSPLLQNYVEKKGLSDYLTGSPGGLNAVREICEMLIGLRGNFEETIAKRVKFAGAYEAYLAQRQSIQVEVEGINDDKV